MKGTGKSLRVRHRRAPTAAGCVGLLALAFLLAWVPSDAVGQGSLNVTVRPDHARVSPDGSVQFTATVRAPDGSDVDANLEWSVIPPRIGTAERGVFVPSVESGRGIVRVVATASGARGSGHAVVEIGAGQGERLAVTVRPLRAAVDPLGEIRFGADVTDPATGRSIDAVVTWSVVPPELGTIDQDGLFRAGPEDGTGRVAVRAREGTREGIGDAGVAVGPATPAGVRVSVLPGNVTLNPGSRMTFAAHVFDESGVPVDAEVEWTLVPARLGAIDTNGNLVAGPEETTGRVVATVVTETGPARGLASVEIRRPGPGNIRVVIAPHEVALTPGGDVRFEAAVSGPDGEPLDVSVDWNVRPEWLGTITEDGLLIVNDEPPEPPVNGRWIGTVVASVETAGGIVSDAAGVVVRAEGPLLRLRIRPQRATVAPGEDLQFEAIVIGGADRGDWTTEWAVFPEDLGTITPDGLFTANAALGDPASGEFGPRAGVVAARATFPDGSSITDRAHVRVQLRGQPVRIIVRPALAIVSPNESQQFEAAVLGSDGQVYDLPVRWRVAPDNIGSISPDGLFTAADLNVDTGGWRRPRGQVVAELTVGAGRVFRGAAVVIIDLPNPQVFVAVSPKSATLGSGESLQLSALVTDAEGQVLTLPVEWTVTDHTVGTVSPDGLFTASTEIPSGTTRRTQVIAWVTYEGRAYWDFATLRVSGQ